MVHRPLMLNRNAHRSGDAFLPCDMSLNAANHRFQLRLENLRQNSIQILIIIVKRLAIDLAPRHQIGHGDLVEGAFIQHFDKHAANHVSRIFLSHVIPPRLSFFVIIPILQTKSKRFPFEVSPCDAFFAVSCKKVEKGA